jgi:hypothetical protein
MIARALLIGSAVALLMTAAPAVIAAGKKSHDAELLAKGPRLIQSDAGQSFFTSTSFVNVTATSSLSVGANKTGFLVATFTSESLCEGPSGWCSLRIRCDGVDLQPATGTTFAFDSPGDTFESNSMTRHSAVFTGGSHSCAVDAAVVSGATNFRLQDWTFEVEFWKQ